MNPTSRHFISAAGRRVHLRIAGDGPPVLLLHGSPGDSRMLEAEITALARHFTVFAPDTPGFGYSDPLPGETLEVRDLACATAETIRALALPPCRVYGTHTGAAIAIELGVGWPDLVSGLVMEGLPSFTAAEIAAIFPGYFAPMHAEPLGGHFTRTWMRFRDQFTWFPWPSRDVRRLNPLDRPSPEDIDLWVSMFYRSCRHYAPAYRAACFYGEGALRAAAALRVPAIYTAAVSDMLHPHLARLPPLRADQRIAWLPEEAAGRQAALIEFLHALPGGGAAPKLPRSRPVGAQPGLMFLAHDGADQLVRCYGDATKPALIIAHDAPGSGLLAEDLARALGDAAHVIVPDLPGCGDSGLGKADDPILDQAARAIGAVADQLGLTRFALLGTGCGAAVAARCGQIGDARLSMLLAHAPPRPDATVAAAIAPDLALSPVGAHWLRAWLMLRDSQIYRPWFDGRVAAQRPDQGNFDADWLHAQTVALMAGRTTYGKLPRAAWAFDSDAALAQARVPVHHLPKHVWGTDALAACITTILAE